MRHNGVAMQPPQTCSACQQEVRSTHDGGPWTIHAAREGAREVWPDQPDRELICARCFVALAPHHEPERPQPGDIQRVRLDDAAVVAEVFGVLALIAILVLALWCLL